MDAEIQDLFGVDFHLYKSNLLLKRDISARSKQAMIKEGVVSEVRGMADVAQGLGSEKELGPETSGECSHVRDELTSGESWRRSQWMIYFGIFPRRIVLLITARTLLPCLHPVLLPFPSYPHHFLFVSTPSSFFLHFPCPSPFRPPPSFFLSSPLLLLILPFSFFPTQNLTLQPYYHSSPAQSQVQ